MPRAEVSADQVREVLQKAWKHGLGTLHIGAWRANEKDRASLREIAAKMGMPPATLSTYIYSHARRLGWDARNPETWVGEFTPLDVRERMRYAQTISKLQADLRSMAKSANYAEDLRQAVFGLAAQPLDHLEIPAPKMAQSAIPSIPVLFCSDFQWGEVIRKDQLDGVNEFNLKVARERYKLLIRKTLDICQHHTGKPHAKRFIYLRGGDMVSGDIHQELRETNAAMSVGQVVDLVEHEAAGIQMIRDAGYEVEVASVPGNHGRTTIKPQSKGYVETNFDTLSAWMLEREFKGDKGVRFYTPSSGDALFRIYGWQFCMTHGDRIGSRGGQGFIGAAATIARGMKRVYEYYGKLGTQLDYILTGHFHSAMELEWGFANGSLPGMSEYARDFRATPARPSQLLFFVHPHTGVTSRWPIYLAPPVKLGTSEKAFEFLRAA